MSEAPPTDPIVYLSRHNGKRIAVCLSTFGKWAAGIVAGLFTAGSVATFSMIWSSNENSKAALIELRQLRETVEHYERDNEKRHDGFDQRLRDLEKGE